MPLPEALQVLQAHSQQAVVISTMGAAREWAKLDPSPLDFVYVPSSMGQAPSLGLGVALAQPARQVIICNGDGCMLMNLGCLVTITAASPDNLVLIVVENGIYEVTGGQATTASAARRQDGEALQFSSMARACGFKSVFEFASLEDWTARCAEVIKQPGPVFICLQVEGVEGDVSPRSPGPASERVARFREALQA
jgi:thiamine pyrophosphate-dependent acetolactate synthase large subunit-like protein